MKEQGQSAQLYKCLVSPLQAVRAAFVVNIRCPVAWKTFTDTAKTLRDNFGEAVAHRSAVLADPDSYIPEKLPERPAELPTHLYKHEHKGVLLGYRVRLEKNSRYFEWNRAFTSTAFPLSENLEQAKEYLSIIPIPTEELPKFVNFYKKTRQVELTLILAITRG